MNALLEKSGIATFCDEFLHFQEFGLTTGFEALRIVKDKVVVAPENQLILDVVLSALMGILVGSRFSPTRRIRNTHPSGSFNLGGINLIRRLGV